MTDTNTETRADLAEAQGEDLPTPSQGGSSGGELAREVGQRDETKASFEDAGAGNDPSVTRVTKGDKANDGDMPSLPNRDGGSGLKGSGGA